MLQHAQFQPHFLRSVHRRGKSAKKLTCHVGVAHIKRQYTHDGLEGRHAISRNLGGASDQALIFLPAETHRMFHWVLHVVLKNDPAFKGKGNWTSAVKWEEVSTDQQGRRLLYQAIYSASGLIDRVCELRRDKSLRWFVRKHRAAFVGEG